MNLFKIKIQQTDVWNHRGAELSFFPLSATRWLAVCVRVFGSEKFNLVFRSRTYVAPSSANFEQKHPPFFIQYLCSSRGYTRKKALWENTRKRFKGTAKEEEFCSFFKPQLFCILKKVLRAAAPACRHVTAVSLSSAAFNFIWSSSLFCIFKSAFTPPLSKAFPLLSLAK